MLFQIDIKLFTDLYAKTLCLRVMLFQIDIKLKRIQRRQTICLRVMLFQIDIKPRKIVPLKQDVFESNVILDRYKTTKKKSLAQ